MAAALCSASKGHTGFVPTLVVAALSATSWKGQVIVLSKFGFVCWRMKGHTAMMLFAWALVFVSALVFMLVFVLPWVFLSHVQSSACCGQPSNSQLTWHHQSGTASRCTSLGTPETHRSKACETNTTHKFTDIDWRHENDGKQPNAGRSHDRQKQVQLSIIWMTGVPWSVSLFENFTKRFSPAWAFPRRLTKAVFLNREVLNQAVTFKAVTKNPRQSLPLSAEETRTYFCKWTKLLHWRRFGYPRCCRWD